MALKVLALGGDGIGPEVLEGALKVLEAVERSTSLSVNLGEDLLHGAAWDAHGTFLHPNTLQKAKDADALLVGAVGGPAWNHIVVEGGPEEQDGLMKLRHELEVFACIRQARSWEGLVGRTPFDWRRIEGADVVVMRELCGGAMFCSDRGIEPVGDAEHRAWDMNVYTSMEIERFARIGFEVARRRKRRLASVDKSNVFMVGKLWREVVERVGQTEYPDIELVHLFADNASYQLCCNPAAFDVVLADNLCGAIAGSLGMLPSACLSDLPRNGPVQGPAIYEPVHGSAPDLAGRGVANPLGMILSMAMMLEYSAGMKALARKAVSSVASVLAEGFATRDLGGNHTTSQMTDAVIRAFRST